MKLCVWNSRGEQRAHVNTTCDPDIVTDETFYQTFNQMQTSDRMVTIPYHKRIPALITYADPDVRDGSPRSYYLPDTTHHTTSQKLASQIISRTTVSHANRSATMNSIARSSVRAPSKASEYIDAKDG
eukprot:IDg11284t1